MATGDGSTNGASQGVDEGARIRWALLLPLLMHSAILQLGTQLTRVNMTYRAIEMDLSVVWIGGIATSYALFPALIAMQIGRFVDRYGDVTGVLTGSILTVLATFGVWLAPPGLVPLLLFSTLLGLSQTFAMTSQQSFSAVCSGREYRDSVFGYYMLSLAVGQAVGPLVLSYLSGNSAVPPTNKIFLFTACSSLAVLAIAFLLRSRSGPRTPPPDRPRVPLREIVKTKGLLAMAMGSALVVTAMDLSIIYLPVLGTERGIDAGTIGYLLSLRAVGSIVARIFYGALVRRLGRLTLMFAVMLGSAGSLLVIALPLPLWVLAVAVCASGFCLGTAIVATLTTLVDMAPAEVRGTALAIRQTFNRMGQLSLPLVVSVIATVTGAGGIFVVTAAAVGISGFAANRSVRQARRSTES